MTERFGISFTNPWTQMFMCLALGLALRVAAFGDPNIYVDESFYLLVGHEMHLGAVPYVDILDRKPLGLFIAYWIFASFPDGVLAYQIAAWLFASATAFIIARIASRWLPPLAALCGAVLYLTMLGTLGGIGGQSPVFYNAFVAGAALQIFEYLDRSTLWRLCLGMLLLGIAITFKPTVTFEAAFFGLLALVHHRNWRIMVLQVILGVLPFAVIAGWYWACGYWSQFYLATVTASLARPAMHASALAFNGTILALVLTPLLALVAFALTWNRGRMPTRILIAWLVAALAGFLSVPYLIEHYALPLLVPLCIVASSSITRRPVGPILYATVMVLALAIAKPWDYQRHLKSRQEFSRMVDAVGPVPPGRSILVYDGPPLIYQATGTRPMSVLAFPSHLHSTFEKNLGPEKSGVALDRILERSPAAVVMLENSEPPPDPEAYGRLLSYVRMRCHPPVRAQTFLPYGKAVPQLVYSGCV